MSSTLITLDVGGTLFKTYQSTLLKSEYFRTMFEFNKEFPNPIFIDCDPRGFKHILEYLRFGNYQIPPKYSYLLAYFMIDESVCNLNLSNMIIYNGKIRAINRKTDVILTIGNAIQTVSSILSQSLNSHINSENLFLVMEILIEEHEIQQLCSANDVEFITQTLILQKERFGRIELYNEWANSDISFCYSSSKDLTSPHRSFTLDPKFGMYISYDSISFMRVKNLYKCIREQRLTKAMEDYVSYFITMITTSSKWGSIQNIICYVDQKS